MWNFKKYREHILHCWIADSLWILLSCRGLCQSIRTITLAFTNDCWSLFLKREEGFVSVHEKKTHRTECWLTSRDHKNLLKKKRVFRTSGISFLTTFNTLAVGERCPVVSFVSKCCVITGIWKIKEFSKWLQLIAKGTREFLQTFHFKCEPRGGTGWIIRRWSGLLGHVVGGTWISATNFHVRNSVQQLPGLIRVERSGIPREIHG